MASTLTLGPLARKGTLATNVAFRCPLSRLILRAEACRHMWCCICNVMSSSVIKVCLCHVLEKDATVSKHCKSYYFLLNECGFIFANWLQVDFLRRFIFAMIYFAFVALSCVYQGFIPLYVYMTILNISKTYANNVGQVWLIPKTKKICLNRFCELAL